MLRPGLSPVPIIRFPHRKGWAVSRTTLSVRAAGNEASEATAATTSNTSEAVIPDQHLSYQQQPQYSYGAVPQYPAPPPGYAPPKSGVPAWVWVGVGIVLALGFNKVMELVRGGPQMMQQKAQEMMMKQMMSQMGLNNPGTSPFGAQGSPFGAAAGSAPFGAPNNAPGGSGTNTPPPSTTWANNAWTKPNEEAPVDIQIEPEKERSSSTWKSDGNKTSDTQSASQSKEGSQQKPAPGAAAEKPPASSSRSYFTDYDEQEVPGSKTGSNGATQGGNQGAPGGNPWSAAGEQWAPPGSQASGAQGSAPGAGNQTQSSTVDMLEQMMRDPELQKTLYPYLPEPMRNPETMEWMLSQPQYRQQLEQMMSQMPANAGGMGGMPDLNSPEVKAQFDQLGMSPQEVVSKILADPELAQAFQNPKVQQAIMELSSNPMAMMKYQNDPEIMNLMTKIATVFPQANVPPPPPPQSQK